VRTLFNWIYIWGHWPVIAASLIWLATKHPAIFTRARNAMLLSGGIGVVVFVLFPVAPPRLAGIGMADTVTLTSHSYRILQPHMFTNQFAAMPSLHVGWNLLIGMALVTAARGLLLRVVGVLMPAGMAVATILTANHYIVDVLVGASLTTACWLLFGWLAARRQATPGER
jgi:membrane-associated phospholipid phosphatase